MRPDLSFRTVVTFTWWSTNHLVQMVTSLLAGPSGTQAQLGNSDMFQDPGTLCCFRESWLVLFLPSLIRVKPQGYVWHERNARRLPTVAIKRCMMS